MTKKQSHENSLETAKDRLIPLKSQIFEKVFCQKPSLLLMLETLVAIGKQQSENNETTWTYGSLDGSDSTCSIIPICYASTSDTHSKWKQYTICTSAGAPCRATARTYLQVELAFSTTVHKAQGKTMGKIILALEERPSGMPKLTYAHLFVALSRVQKASDMQLLITSPAGRSSLDYINDLRPCPDNAAFFAGYDTSRDCWSATDALAHTKESS